MPLLTFLNKRNAETACKKMVKYRMMDLMKKVGETQDNTAGDGGDQ